MSTTHLLEVQDLANSIGVPALVEVVPNTERVQVLVAVELVLESGSLSAEHILNVVARLTAFEPPPSVETHLSLKEAPVANTARYDRLRGQAEEVGHA